MSNFFRRKAHELGVVFGLIASSVGPVILSNWIYARRLIVAAILIFALPPAINYWLTKIQYIPTVPITAIVAMFAGGFFLLCATVCFYVATLCLRQISFTEKAVIGHRRTGQVKATEGSFTTMSDERALNIEQLQELKQKGILREEDKAQIEEAMNELAQRRRNR